MTTTAKLSESNFASLAEMMSAYAEQAVQLGLQLLHTVLALAVHTELTY